MKRRLFFIVLFLTISLYSMAQAVGEAMYIYRNDGQFNAFFCDEIISIDYSYEDVDGNHYDEVVTQIVNAGDSLYYIPLAAIDSVSFVKPEIILQPNVVLMNQNGLMDYLEKVDGMALLFKNTLPSELLPKVGEVLVCADFDNPMLTDGFAGKVLSLSQTSDVIRVECDSIYDVFDIFEQLTSLEAIGFNGSNARRKSEGEWISEGNIVSLNIGLEDEKKRASIDGSIEGTYFATVAYNITRKQQSVNVRVLHNWQYGLNFKIKFLNEEVGTLLGKVVSLPAIRFPKLLPIFKFQVSGVPFVKAEGNVELSFSKKTPVNSYYSEINYSNGSFGAWSNKRISGTDNNSLDTEGLVSFNGSAQAGCMIDFWLGLNIFGGKFKLGSGLDFYIGPKLEGNFDRKGSSEIPINNYTLFKDSKISFSPLAVDFEFFGEAELGKYKLSKYMFCEGSMFSPFKYERYIFPEFSNLSIYKDDAYRLATIETTPKRNLWLPVDVGIGIYDQEGNTLSTQYERRSYWNDNGRTISQTFESLEYDTEYTAKPVFKFFGDEIAALPQKQFKLEKKLQATVYTYGATNIRRKSATLCGQVYIEGVDVAELSGTAGFLITTEDHPDDLEDISKWEYKIVGTIQQVIENGGEMEMNVSGLTPEKDYKYRAVVIIDNTPTLGQMMHFYTDVDISIYATYVYSGEDKAIIPVNMYISDDAAVSDCRVSIEVREGDPKAYPTSYPVSLFMKKGEVRLTNLDSETTYYVTPIVVFDDKRVEGKMIHFTTKPDDNVLVDLGLSVKWARWDIGAAGIDKSGDTYCWGTIFDIDEKDYRNPTNEDISGNMSYDVATKEWGGDWRMPTKEEYEELIEKCSFILDTESFGNYVIVKGPNGKSIKFKYLHSIEFWTSTPEDKTYAYQFFLSYRKEEASVRRNFKNAKNYVRAVHP